MAKYAMLNCWSDLNRGDLGIMLASIEEIKRQDPQAEIIGISSFRKDDPMFNSNHRVLRQYIDKIIPSLNGVLGLRIFGKLYKNNLCKIIAFLFETIRFEAIMIMPINMAEQLLSKDEKDILDILTTCGVTFSKGGSVFTDYGSLRGKIGLYRVCHLFDLLNKFAIPYYILGQSFGPVSEGVGSKKVNNIIKNARKVFLREFICVKKYPWLNLNGNNVCFSNDTAFLLSPRKPDNPVIDESKINIGMTVRPVNGDVDGYIKIMVRVIAELLEKDGVVIHIFQQVAMDDEPDNVTAAEILSKVHPLNRDKVIYHTEEMDPHELCWMYGQLRLLIGTRLHSTIFAMAAGTPAIGLVYHGTKTQGIFSNIGVPELVLEAPFTAEDIIEKVRYVETEYSRLKDIVIARGVQKAKAEMREAIGDMVSFANMQN